MISAVTEQNKHEVLRIAEMIVELCRKHTSNANQAIASIQIAREVILAEQAVQSP